MDPMSLLDAPSAAIVLGGTLIATWLRSGHADCRQTLRAIASLGAAPFDADGARAELAVQIREIRQDGLLRATPHHFGDSEFDEVTDALIGHRSIPALLEAHEAHRSRRVEANNRAVRTLAQAAELAPVFGLAGTLVSLSQLPEAGISRGAFTGAIGMAVLTTLYGLLLANLLLAPLSRKVERAAAEEEAERQKLVDWLAGQVSGEIPLAGRPHGTATARASARTAAA